MYFLNILYHFYSNRMSCVCLSFSLFAARAFLCSLALSRSFLISLSHQQKQTLTQLTNRNRLSQLFFLFFFCICFSLYNSLFFLFSLSLVQADILPLTLSLSINTVYVLISCRNTRTHATTTEGFSLCVWSSLHRISSLFSPVENVQSVFADVFLEYLRTCFTHTHKQ